MLVEPAIGEKAGPGDAIFSGPRTQCLTANPGPVDGGASSAFTMIRQ